MYITSRIFFFFLVRNRLEKELPPPTQELVSTRAQALQIHSDQCPIPVLCPGPIPLLEAPIPAAHRVPVPDLPQLAIAVTGQRSIEVGATNMRKCDTKNQGRREKSARVGTITALGRRERDTSVQRVRKDSPAGAIILTERGTGRTLHSLIQSRMTCCHKDLVYLVERCHQKWRLSIKAHHCHHIASIDTRKEAKPSVAGEG